MAALSISTALLLLTAAAAPARAAMAAWWTGIGPQIILQNTTTGAIRHSSCNVFETPYYSHTDDSELPLHYKPKSNTPLAGAGYWNEQTTIASVFYLDKDNGIANAVLECDMQTGLFKSQGNWIISDSAHSIHPNSGLAVVLLGSSQGYRVYYHDENMAVNELGYAQDEGWEWRRVVSPYHQPMPAMAIGSTNANITIVTAYDEDNLEEIRYNSDGLWWTSKSLLSLYDPLQDIYMYM